MRSSWCRGVTGGGRGRGQGTECPLTFFTGNSLLTYRENKGKENRKMEKKRQTVKGKAGNYKWKSGEI